MSCLNEQSESNVAHPATGDKFAVIRIIKGTIFFENADKLFITALRHLNNRENSWSVCLLKGPYLQRDFELIRDMLVQTEASVPDSWESVVECDVLSYSATLSDAKVKLSELMNGGDTPDPDVAIKDPKHTESLQRHVPSTVAQNSSHELVNTSSERESIGKKSATNSNAAGAYGKSSRREVSGQTAQDCSKLTEHQVRQEQQFSFTIKIEGADFESIKPVYVKEKDRETKRFQGSWTRLINTKIWECKKLPCPFAFRNQHFHEKDGFPYYDLTGYCSDKNCRSIIYGTCPNEEKGCTTINMTVKHFCPDIVHTKKLQVSGEFRNVAGNTLRAVKPLAFQHKVANELLGSDSDEDCPLIASTQVYAQVRQQEKDKSLKIGEYGKDVITALAAMKAELPYIRSISTLPFSVRFWNQNQIDFWNLFRKLLDGQVLIDATGGLPSTFEIIKGHPCPDIFFYNIVTSIPGDPAIYSLSQNLSSAHDGRTIYLWLYEWRMSIEDVPREVVLDGAAALANGVSLAFNDMEFSDYISNGLDLLEKKSSHVPPCLIKRDPAHQVKLFCTSDLWKGDNWPKKLFYVSSVTFARKITTLSEIKKFISTTFVIANSESRCPGDACSEGILWLKGKIATFTVEEESANEASAQQSTNCYEYLNKDFDKFSPRTKLFVEKIYNDSVRLCGNVRRADAIPNEYFLPKVCDLLIPLFHQFPVWTNVLNQFYPKSSNDPDSARVEAFYKIVKKDYGLKGPTSVHRFIKEFNDNTNGAIKLGMRELKKLR